MLRRFALIGQSTPGAFVPVEGNRWLPSGLPAYCTTQGQRTSGEGTAGHSTRSGSAPTERWRSLSLSRTAHMTELA